MRLYTFLLTIVKVLLRLINGPMKIIGQENIPKETSIIASTHRHWLDPVILAIAFPDRELAFMAKDTLFKGRLMGWLLPRINVFPVNREKPSPKSLRHGVEVMANEDKHLGIFPTGSRYTTEIKGGTAFLQRLSKKDIIPVSIQPPLSWGQLFGRKQIKVAIGEPIAYDPEAKYDKVKLKEIDDALANAFNQLDKQLDPDYVFIPKQKKEN